jgi:hypothetical protein
MAAFPSTLKIGMDSRPVNRDGREIDHDGDGLALVRKMHDDRVDFIVSLPRMTSAEVTTLMDFYAANELIAFDFVWPLDGLTYSQRFGARPRLVSFTKGGRYTYEVRMVAA